MIYLAVYNDGNCISGIMVSVLASSVVFVSSSPSQVKPKTIKLVYVASLISM